MRNLRKKLGELRRERRKRYNEPPKDTPELRHDFHQTHQRTKWLAHQQKTFQKKQRLMKEAFKFPSNPFKYRRKVFSSKSTATPTFSAGEQRPSFQNVSLTQTAAIATAPSVNSLHLRLQSLTSLLLRLRLMNTKKCSFRGEILPLLVPTASQYCVETLPVFSSAVTFYHLSQIWPNQRSIELPTNCLV